MAFPFRNMSTQSVDKCIMRRPKPLMIHMHQHHSRLSKLSRPSWTSPRRWLLAPTINRMVVPATIFLRKRKWEALTPLTRKDRLPTLPSSTQKASLLSSRWRTVGRRRSRQSCADSGWTDKPARIVRKIKAVGLHTARTSSKRRRDWADSTWLRSVRISWITLRSALMDNDVSSSTQLGTSARARITETWSKTMPGTRRWGSSRT